MTHDAIQENELSAADRWVINSQKETINVAFEQLEATLTGLRSGRLGLEMLASMEDKLIAQSNQLSSFLDILQG